MEYLVLLLFFAGIFVIFAWGLKRDLWKIGRNRSCCAAPFDREEALREEEEARQKRRARKLAAR